MSTASDSRRPDLPARLMPALTGWLAPPLRPQLIRMASKLPGDVRVSVRPPHRRPDGRMLTTPHVDTYRPLGMCGLPTHRCAPVIEAHAGASHASAHVARPAVTLRRTLRGPPARSVERGEPAESPSAGFAFTASQARFSARQSPFPSTGSLPSAEPHTYAPRTAGKNRTR